MEDVLTLVLIIILCLLLKPLISAILRGLGSSEHAVEAEKKDRRTKNRIENHSKQ